jgi:glycosyltransferase involved in cell wall biosynthesis
MIKVLLVMTARQVGGAELYVERLVRALSDRCKFTIAISDHPDMRDLNARLSRSARVLPFTFDRIFSLFNIARDLRRLAAEHDVVHINSNHPASRLGILMGFLLGGQGAPVVCVEHRATPLSDVRVPRTLAWCLPTLFRWSRRNVARVIAMSRQNARVLVQYYRLSPSIIEVVYNGVHLGEFNAVSSTTPTLRQELGLGDDQPIILVLARLQPSKGHRFLIQAAPDILSQFPNVHFVFAGSPDDRVSLDQQIAQANLADRFSILGHRTDVVNLLRSSDVFVLPSLAEGFALSIIEALAVGLPVVATQVGGAAEIIDPGENGFLVPPADVAALSHSVKHVLSSDASTKSRLREAALDTAQRFSTGATAQNMFEIYQNVTELT